MEGREQACQGESERFSISLLGGFELICCGEVQRLPLGSQRLLALLALHPEGLARPWLASQLWAGESDERAQARLRTALWRLGSRASGVVDSSARQLSVRPHVVIDLRAATQLALACVNEDSPLPTDQRARLTVVDTLGKPLLPGWLDDWLEFYAEKWRQLRLHALERFSARLESQGDHMSALLAALASAEADPDRESARASIMRLYLAEGNASEAARELERFRNTLDRDLGAAPSRELWELIRPE